MKKGKLKFNKCVSLDSLESCEHLFGEQKNYKEGDVVVWRGNKPCIGKIVGKCDSYEDCFKINKTHSSLHYSNLRYATQKEKQKLGRKQMVLIAKNSV